MWLTQIFCYIHKCFINFYFVRQEYTFSFSKHFIVILNNDIIHNQNIVEYIIAHETLYWNTGQEIIQIQRISEKISFIYPQDMIWFLLKMYIESWEEFQYLSHDDVGNYEIKIKWLRNIISAN